MSLDRWLINLLSLIAISFSCLLEKEPSYVVKDWKICRYEGYYLWGDVVWR